MLDFILFLILYFLFAIILGIVPFMSCTGKDRKPFFIILPYIIIDGFIISSPLIDRNLSGISNILLLISVVAMIVALLAGCLNDRNHKDNNPNNNSDNVTHTEEDTTDYSDRIID